MTDTLVPPAVTALARRRAAARAARDWPTADRLRGEIEAAGWRVIDAGTDFLLEPAHPPDRVDAGRLRYGASTSVPSRLGEPATAAASVILVATDRPADVGRAVAGLRRHAPAGTQVIVVADAPSPEQAAALEQAEVAEPAAGTAGGAEVVWTNQRLGHAAALNAGIRRALGRVVIVLGAGVEPTGDIVTPLVGALDDPAVAVAGPSGVLMTDLRHVRQAPPGDVDAIDGSLQAFRRADYATRGPFDEKFTLPQHLDAWWSLVLRDAGEAEPPRRALAVPGVPAVQHETPTGGEPPEAERARLAKRNFYRLLDRFGGRPDLLLAARRAGDR